MRGGDVINSLKDVHPYLKALMPLVDGIAKTFGSDCEVVLHDLSRPRTSVIKIANSHVTGRKVGDGIRDLVLTVLRSEELENDVLANYETITEDQRRLKSTTMLIRDPINNDLIGCLCINYDLKDFDLIKKIISKQMYTKPLNLKQYGLESNDGSDDSLDTKTEVLEILQSIITKTIKETGSVPETMSRTEKINIVRFLEEKGVFLIKGAVQLAAKELRVSVYTIYNYLDLVRTNKR